MSAGGKAVTGAALALALLLAGCAGPPPGPWFRPDAGPQATAAAESECRNEANGVLAGQRQIDQDILATRERDWQSSHTATGHRHAMFAEAAGRAEAQFAACMRAKGFSRLVPVPAPPPPPVSPRQ